MCIVARILDPIPGKISGRRAPIADKATNLLTLVANHQVSHIARDRAANESAAGGALVLVIHDKSGG